MSFFANPSSSSYRPTTHSRLHSEQSELLFKQQNEALLSRLNDKTNRLKLLSIDIGNEIRTQNKMLSDMDVDFENTQGFMKHTIGKLTHMMIHTGSSNRYMCIYLIAFILCIFILVYLFIK